MISKIVQSVMSFDIEQKAMRGGFLRDPGQRALIAALLTLNVFAYFIFVAHHPLHNHVLRLPWIPWNEQIYLGRWFNIFMLRLVHASDMPVFLPVLSSVIGIFAGVFMLKVWRLRLSRVEEFLVIGMLTTYPAFLAYYYYTWLTPLFMIGSLFATVSLYSCRELRPFHIIWGAFWFMLMMASYQPSLSVYATVAAAALVCDLTRSPTVLLGDIARVAGARIAAALLGAVAYLVSLSVLGIDRSHATTPLEFADMPGRFVDVVKASFNQLTVTQPEFFTSLKLFLLGVLILAVLVSLIQARRSLPAFVLTAVVWVGALVATKTMFLISADANFYQYRYNVATGFFYAFAGAMLLQATTIKPVRSLSFLIVAFVLLRFVQADLTRQEILLRGQEHDLAISNRVLSRIEAMPEIDFSQTYDFVRIGNYSDYRMRTLKTRQRTYEIGGDGHMDVGEVTGPWTDEAVFVLLGTKLKLKNTGFDSQFREKIVYARENLVEGRDPWPAPNSVFIEDGTIYVYFK